MKPRAVATGAPRSGALLAVSRVALGGLFGCVLGAVPGCGVKGQNVSQTGDGHPTGGGDGVSASDGSDGGVRAGAGGASTSRGGNSSGGTFASAGASNGGVAVGGNSSGAGPSVGGAVGGSGEVPLFPALNEPSDWVHFALIGENEVELYDISGELGSSAISIWELSTPSADGDVFAATGSQRVAYLEWAPGVRELAMLVVEPNQPWTLLRTLREGAGPTTSATTVPIDVGDQEIETAFLDEAGESLVHPSLFWASGEDLAIVTRDLGEGTTSYFWSRFDGSERLGDYAGSGAAIAASRGGFLFTTGDRETSTLSWLRRDGETIGVSELGASYPTDGVPDETTSAELVWAADGKSAAWWTQEAAIEDPSASGAWVNAPAPDLVVDTGSLTIGHVTWPLLWGDTLDVQEHLTSRQLAPTGFGAAYVTVNDASLFGDPWLNFVDALEPGTTNFYTDAVVLDGAASYGFLNDRDYYYLRPGALQDDGTQLSDLTVVRDYDEEVVELSPAYRPRIEAAIADRHLVFSRNEFDVPGTTLWQVDLSVGPPIAVRVQLPAGTYPVRDSALPCGQNPLRGVIQGPALCDAVLFRTSSDPDCVTDPPRDGSDPDAPQCSDQTWLLDLSVTDGEVEPVSLGVEPGQWLSDGSGVVVRGSDGNVEIWGRYGVRSWPVRSGRIFLPPAPLP